MTQGNNSKFCTECGAIIQPGVTMLKENRSSTLRSISGSKVPYLKTTIYKSTSGGYFLYRHGQFTDPNDPHLASFYVVDHHSGIFSPESETKEGKLIFLPTEDNPNRGYYYAQVYSAKELHFSTAKKYAYIELTDFTHKYTHMTTDK